MRSWAGPTGQPRCQLLPNSAAVAAVTTALNVFAAIAVCFGIGRLAVGAGVDAVAVGRGIGWVVGATERVGVGVGLGVGVGVGAVVVAVGAAVGTGTGAAGVPGEVTAADERATPDESAGLGALDAEASRWPVVQEAHRTELKAANATSGSSGRPGRDRHRPRRNTGIRPG